MKQLLDTGLNLPSLALAALVALAFGGLVLVLARLAGASRQATRLDKVLAGYARNLGAETSGALGLSKPARFPLLDRLIKATDESLAAAGIELPGTTWVLGATAVAVVLGLLSGMFFGAWPLGLAIGAASGYYLMVVFLAGRVRARSVKFATDLPQVLAIIASGLRAGLTFPSALSASAMQDQGEVGRQLRRALAEVQFGSTIEDALRRVAKRMSSADLEWLVLALQIQREVGGSLSGILESVAVTIKGRSEIAREVRVISAEGRMSGYVLIALPIFSFVALFVVRPEYVRFFWTEPLGFILLGSAVALMVAGWVWMSRVVAVRV